MAPESDDREDLALLWQSAILEYEKDAERKLRQETLSAFRNLSSPEGLLEKITASSESFKDFRSKRAKLWNRLKTFSTPLQTLVNLASSSTAYAGPAGTAASIVLSASMFLIKSCENVSDAYDWIEQLFTELQEFSERLTFYAQTRMDPVLQKKIVSILAFVLRVIGRSECLIREKRFREYLRVTFLGKDEKTKQLLDELNKLFGSEQRFVVAVTYATTLEIKENQAEADQKLAAISEHAKDIKAMLNETATKNAVIDGQKLLESTLCATCAASDVEDIFDKNRENLLKGTGAWLEHESLFNDWIDHRAPILWIFGGPGVGKSYLATWIVNELPKRKPQGTTYAYFFVKESSQILREANTILKTLAWQLVGQDSEFKKYVVDVCGKPRLIRSAEDTWKNVFLGYYSRPEQSGSFATIVIDGLDEATKATRRAFVDFMKDLVSSSQSPNRPAIQFAIVGRPSLRESMDFKRHEKGFIIEVSKWKNKQDIDSYIQKRLREVDMLKELRKIKPNGLKQANKIGAIIRAKVLKGSDGVFLWAKLLIDTIVHRDLTQIDTLLKNPPRDLDDMIRAVFERLAADDEIDHEMLKEMLLFCTHSQRPLKFGELDLFLSLSSQKVNYLLWKHTRGKLSSVFDLKPPPGFNLDQEEEISDEDTNEGSEDTDDDEFDFTGGDGDEDEDLFESLSGNSQQSDPTIGANITSSGSQDHLTDHQRNTELTFCHTRIRDFILLCVSDDRFHLEGIAAVIPQSRNAHVDITICCLNALRQEVSTNTVIVDSDENIRTDYPYRFLSLHLERVKRDLTSDDEFHRLIEGLYWVFGTETGAKCFMIGNHGKASSFHRAWVGNNKNLSLVQSWFRDAISRKTVWNRLTPSAKSWMIDAAEGYKTLLKPSMMAASKLWLTKSGYDDPDYGQKGELFCWLLHGWLSLIENGHATRDIQEFNYAYFWDRFDLLSAERLEVLANWAGLKQDTHWHTAIGWILGYGENLDQAASHYKEALAQDPHSWVSLEGLARIYGKRGNLQLAIDCQTKSIEAMPKRIHHLSASCYDSIAEWQMELGNNEAALEAAKLGFEIYPWHFREQDVYLKTLHIAGDSDGVMSTIELMDANEYYGYTLLVNYFCALNLAAFEYIGKAVRDKGQPTWIFQAMDDAIGRLEKEELMLAAINMSFMMADFSYKWYDDRALETIKLFEAFLGRLSSLPSAQEDFENERSRAVNKLAQLYFDQAVISHQDTEMNDAVEKLKGLAVSVRTSSAGDYEGFDFFREDYPSLLWGRWVRQYMKAEATVWRKCFKPRLLCQMNTLDDDEPANDEVGMQSLLISLFHAGDRKNAAAILSVLFKTLEDERVVGDNADTGENKEQVYTFQQREPPDTDKTPSSILYNDSETIPLSDETQVETGIEEADSTVRCEASNTPPQSGGLSLEVDEGGKAFRCDNCGRYSFEVAEMYFCEICDDTNFCGKCLPLVCNRSIVPGLEQNYCNSHHTFYRAWPIAEETRGLAADYLNGKVQLKREWLNTLRDEWLNVV